jgi:hypothetical protein
MRAVINRLEWRAGRLGHRVQARIHGEQALEREIAAAHSRLVRDDEQAVAARVQQTQSLGRARFELEA